MVQKCFKYYLWGKKLFFYLQHYKKPTYLTLCTPHAILVHKGRVNLVDYGAKFDTVWLKSSQLSWAGQYKKNVQYDFKFTSEYSAPLNFNIDTLPLKKS